MLETQISADNFPPIPADEFLDFDRRRSATSSAEICVSNNA